MSIPRGPLADMSLEQRAIERELLYSVANGTTDAVFAKDLDGRYVFANTALAAHFDRELSEILGSTDRELMPLAAAQAVEADDRRAMELGETRTFHETVPLRGALRRYHTTKGPRRDAEGRIIGLFGIARDVTEQEAAAAALRERDLHLRAIHEQAAVGIIFVAATGHFLFANARFCQMLGYSEEELRGRTIEEVTHPHDLLSARANRRRLLDERAPSYTTEKRYVRKDGSECWVRATVSRAHDPHSGRLRLIGVIEDIGEQKRAEEALTRLQHEQAALLDSLPDPAWLKDPYGCYVAANEALARCVGVRLEEIIGRTDQELWQGRTPPLLTDDRLDREGLSRLVTEDELICSDGTRRWFESVRATYQGPSGEWAGTIGFARDITERREKDEALRRSEAQLQQAQKMEAIGRLAGGIAHDFNNLLCAIGGNIDLASMELDPQHPASELVTEARQALARAAELTRQLLVFSRHSSGLDSVIDANAAVESATKLFRHVLGERIVLDVDLDERPMPIVAAAGQIEQILLNLATNARDAMPDGGTLTVTTGEYLLDDLSARRRAVAPGAYVAIVVRDTGCGMDEATQARIFEPFFTTKEIGHGTGLGLATVWALVSRMNGTVLLESRRSGGSCFTVLVPRAQSVPTASTPTVGSAMLAGAGTILLVEDERAVRTTARRILERAGYRVIEAQHGSDALLIWREHRSLIDLVLTDVRMPELGGQELATILRHESAQLPVVYMSGYTGSDLDFEIDEAHETFLQKPFTSEALTRAVRTAMSQRSRGRTA